MRFFSRPGRNVPLSGDRPRQHLAALALMTGLAMACGGGSHGGGSTASPSTPASNPEGKTVQATWKGVKQLGAPGKETRIADTRTDKAGNVYVTGTTTGNLDGEHPNSTWDAFLAKYDPGGKLLFIRQFAPVTVPAMPKGAKDSITPFCLAIDDARGCLYVGGRTYGALAGCKRGGGYSDAFIVKFDADGNRLYNRQFGTSTNGGEWVNVSTMAVDAQGHLYVAGSANGDNLSGSADDSATGSSCDAFLIKYADDAGTVAYKKRFGAKGSYTRANTVFVDPRGNAYLGGFTAYGSGTLFDVAVTGDFDGFLAKYDTDGNALYSKVVLHASLDTGGFDDSGRLFVAGGATRALDSHATQAGKWDACLLQFDVNGSVVSTRQWGVDYAMTWVSSMTIDSGGQIIVAGPDGWPDESQPNTNFFLASHDAGGNRRFLRRLGGKPAVIHAYSIKAAWDTKGSVIVTCNVSQGGLEGTSLIGTSDGFIMKFDSNGVMQ